MIYVSVTLLVLAIVWWGFVWTWLRDNPVPPLAKIDDWRVHRTPLGTPYASAASYPWLYTEIRRGPR